MRLLIVKSVLSQEDAVGGWPVVMQIIASCLICLPARCTHPLCESPYPKPTHHAYRGHLCPSERLFWLPQFSRAPCPPSRRLHPTPSPRKSRRLASPLRRQDDRGWHSTHGPDFPATGWEVKDGLLSVTEHGGEEGGNAGDILTTRKYANFELLVDFRITPGANSGIKYFVDPDPGHEGHGSAIGFEYQILDDAVHPDAKKGRDGNRTEASLYDMIPAARTSRSSP